MNPLIIPILRPMIILPNNLRYLIKDLYVNIIGMGDAIKVRAAHILIPKDALITADMVVKAAVVVFPIVNFCTLLFVNPPCTKNNAFSPYISNR